MSKHTPGPWNALDRAVLKGPPGEERTWIIASCPVNALGKKTKTSEAQANASLIAAAPDLLEAAKNTLVVWERKTGVKVTEGELFGPLLAAIAKAEGTAK